MRGEKKHIEIDVIIWSYAENSNLKTIKKSCLDSLVTSEVPEIIQFNIIVIELEKKMKSAQYSYDLTGYPEQEFGYHTYMNIGLGLTSAAFVCLCNNDLAFHPGWATEILRAFIQNHELSNVSPVCSSDRPKMGLQLNTVVYPGCPCSI